MSTTTPRAVARARNEERTAEPHPATHAIERAILEAHGLPVEDWTARALVKRWHAATLAIIRYVEAKGGDMLDLVDASTLASLLVAASTGT